MQQKNPPPPDETYQLIVLMKSDEFTPGKINAGQFGSLFGEITKAKHLINKHRQPIGNPNNTIGLTFAEIEKQQIGEPDFRLLHPDSVAARLQRYIVLSYQNEHQLEQAKTALSNNLDVLSVSEVKEDEADFSLMADDPLSEDAEQFQYGLFDMDLQSESMNSAWDKAKGHAYVGIPDTGLDVGHPDFLSNFRSHFSFNFVPVDGNEDNDVSSTGVNNTIFRGHGQHVAGIIAADSDNDLGTTGICWHCFILFAKAWFDDEKIPGYNFLAKSGAQVINSSFQLQSPNPSFTCDSQPNHSACDALQLMSYRDIVHIAAAGNGDNDISPTVSIGRSDFIQFPASDDRVIAVGASNYSGQRAVWSDYGPELDIVAPGVKILSTFVSNHNS